MNNLSVNTDATPAPTEIVALMANSWGRGVTHEEAFTNAAENATSYKVVRYLRVPVGKYQVSPIDGSVQYETPETSQPLGELPGETWDMVTWAASRGFTAIDKALKYVVENTDDARLRRRIEAFIDKLSDLEIDVDEAIGMIEQARV